MAGGRTFNDRQRAYCCLDMFHAHWGVTAIICGCAAGADTIGADWAVLHNVLVIRMPADWKTHKKSAGYIRNVAMAEIADYLLVFWNGKSKGTGHMIDIAREKNITMTVLHYD